MSALFFAMGVLFCIFVKNDESLFLQLDILLLNNKIK